MKKIILLLIISLSLLMQSFTLTSLATETNGYVYNPDTYSYERSGDVNSKTESTADEEFGPEYYGGSGTSKQKAKTSENKEPINETKDFIINFMVIFITLCLGIASVLFFNKDKLVKRIHNIMPPDKESELYFESLGVEYPEFYNDFVKEYYNQRNVIYAEKKKEKTERIKKCIKLGVIILVILSLIIGVVVYHNHAIDDAYNNGKSKGYNTGHNEGYFEGYHKGYGHYKDIAEEYNFYHKYAVIVTTTGNKYHKYNCGHIADRSFYIYNIENAKAKGYTPCLDCFD